MRVIIGDKVHSFADPTGLLSDCHQMEMYSELCGPLPKGSNRLRKKKPGALSTRHCDTSPKPPLRTADAEEWLFSRLRKIRTRRFGPSWRILLHPATGTVRC
jgi:hypothetical protein